MTQLIMCQNYILADTLVIDTTLRHQNFAPKVYQSDDMAIAFGGEAFTYNEAKRVFGLLHALLMKGEDQFILEVLANTDAFGIDMEEKIVLYIATRDARYHVKLAKSVLNAKEVAYVNHIATIPDHAELLSYGAVVPEAHAFYDFHDRKIHPALIMAYSYKLSGYVRGDCHYVELDKLTPLTEEWESTFRVPAQIEV